MKSLESAVLVLAFLAPVLHGQSAARADTVPPAAAIETPYTVHSPGLGLAGTLTVPRGARGPVPVAVIIAGSGPTDRNGNSVMGIRPNSYAQPAWFTPPLRSTTCGARSPGTSLHRPPRSSSRST